MTTDEAIQELQRYQRNGTNPGHFLTAVLEGDLYEAMGRADESSRENLFEIVRYIFNYMPRTCWGSREIVQAYKRGAESAAIGRYYDEKAAEARRLSAELAAAENRGASEVELAKLRHQLHMARYTGD